MMDVSTRKTLFLLSRLMPGITLAVTSYGLINIDIHRQSVPETYDWLMHVLKRDCY